MADSNELFKMLVQNSFGGDAKDQTSWLLDNIKRLFPKAGCMAFATVDFQSYPDYGTLN